MVDILKNNELKTFSPFGVWLPLAIFGASISLMVAAGLAIMIATGQIITLTNIDFILALNNVMLTTWGVAAVLLWRKHNPSLKDVFSLQNVNKRTLIFAIAGFTLLQPLLILITSIFTVISGIEVEGNSGEIIQDQLSLIKFLSIVFFAPVFEEIFFRGLLFDGFLNSARKFLPIKDSTRIGITMVFTSVFFGLLHVSTTDLNGFVSFLTTALLGFFFAWLRVKTGNLALSVIAHMIFNSVGYGLIALTMFLANM